MQHIKSFLLLAFLFSVKATFGQWTKIDSIPTNDIVALATHDNTIYAASDSSFIYMSTDSGTTWSTLTLSSSPLDITAITFYNNRIYAGTYTHGVYYSSDN